MKEREHTMLGTSVLLALLLFICTMVGFIAGWNVRKAYHQCKDQQQHEMTKK